MSATKTFKDGEMIITQGDEATHAYMILSGAVHVYLEKDSKTVTLANLEIGAIFGESALFGGDAYGANIAAKGDIELLVITTADFESKKQACDPMIQEIIRMLIERQRKTNDILLKRETQEFMDLVFVET
ncbi:MAG: cyclic nucleotide-binding domain-containing protein [Alphaproteobacteria bacterium]|nr:cyclic nucleotide-binding domain-containing protein [Alphaproteobacteria bacterium]